MKSRPILCSMFVIGLIMCTIPSYAQDLIVQQLHTPKDIILQSTEYFNESVDDIQFSRTGNYVITLSYAEKKIKIWNNLNKTIFREIELDSENYMSQGRAGFIDEEKGVVFCQAAESVHLYNMFTKNKITVLPNAILFSTSLVSGTYLYYNYNTELIYIGKIEKLVDSILQEKQAIIQSQNSIKIKNAYRITVSKGGAVAVYADKSTYVYRPDTAKNSYLLTKHLPPIDASMQINDVEDITFCRGDSAIFFRSQGRCWVQNIGDEKLAFTLPLVDGIRSGTIKDECRNVDYYNFAIIGDSDTLICVGSKSMTRAGLPNRQTAITQVFCLNEKKKIISESQIIGSMRATKISINSEIQKSVILSNSGRMYLFDNILSQVVDEYKLAVMHHTLIYPFEKPSISLPPPLTKYSAEKIIDLTDPRNIFKEENQSDFYLAAKSSSSKNHYIIRSKESRRSIQHNGGKYVWFNIFNKKLNQMREIKLDSKYDNLTPLLLEDTTSVVTSQQISSTGRLRILKFKLDKTEAIEDTSVDPYQHEGYYLAEVARPNSCDILFMTTTNFVSNNFNLHIFDSKNMVSVKTLARGSKKIMPLLDVSESGLYCAAIYYNDFTRPAIDGPFKSNCQDLELTIWNLNSNNVYKSKDISFLLNDITDPRNSHVGIRLIDEHDRIILYVNKKLYIYKLSNLELLEEILNDDLITSVGFSADRNTMIIRSNSRGSKIFSTSWSTKAPSQFRLSIETWENNFLLKNKNNEYYANKEALPYLTLITNDRTQTFEEFDLLLNRPDKIVGTLPNINSEDVSYFKSITERRRESNSIKDNAGNHDLNPKKLYIKVYPPKELKRFTTEEAITLTFQARIPEDQKCSIVAIINGLQVLHEPVNRTGMLQQGNIHLKLTSGLNKIVCFAQYGNGIRSNISTLYINHQSKSKKRLHILGVGISEYDNFDKLSGSKNDILDFVAKYSELCRSSFDTVTIDTIYNKRFTKSSLEKSLASLKSLETNDMLVLYYSGHGKYLRDKKRYYLITPAAPKSDELQFASSSIEFSSLENTLKQLECREIVLFINACESGLPIRNRETFFATKAMFVDLDYGSGLAIVASSYNDGQSHTLSNSRNSVFGEHLLKCLDRNLFYSIDKNSDNIVTINELYDQLFILDKRQREVDQRANFRSQNIDHEINLWRYQ